MMIKKNWMPNRLRMALLTAAATAAMVVAGAGQAAAQQGCVNDDDCPDLACGGQVCNWDNFLKCQPAGMVEAGKDGWCMDDTDCKCRAEGATCNTTTFHCTFTKPPSTGTGGASGTGTGGASGTGTGGAGTTPPKDDGGGCSVAGGASAGAFGGVIGAVLWGALLAARSRRRRA